MRSEWQRHLAGLAFSAGLAAAGFSQTTWHVDDDGTPPGTGTPGDPFTSIQYAIENAPLAFGDVILVAPGLYEENVDVPAGTPVISIAGSGPAATVLRPVSQFVRIRNVILSDLTVEAGAYSGTGIRFCDADIKHCVVQGFDQGLLTDCSGSLIRSCTVTNNGVGLFFFGLGDVLRIDGSIFWGNDQDFNARTTFVDLFFSIVGDYPDFWQGSGNQQVDPLFWDHAAGDYHLRPGSPAIGTGFPAGADVGAFPYDPTYAPQPETFCVTAPNSVGAGALIGSTGSLSIAVNDFTLLASEGPPNQFGKFYYGPATAQTPFGDGFRCISPGGIGVFRLYPAQVSDAQGNYARLVDFTAPPAGSGPGTILPGSTWYFQYWYRDPFGPGGSGFNFSNGLQAGFVP